jgi:hypothetical protein
MKEEGGALPPLVTEDPLDDFRAAARPIAQEAGIEEPPGVFPAHTFVSA